MQRRSGVVLFVVLALVAVLIIRTALNPLRQSDIKVRSWLLSQTPLGSRRADVASFLNEKGWHDEAYQRTIPPPATYPFLGGHIGTYQGLPWGVHVRAFWEFDAEGRLTNIVIDRVVDSP